MQAAYRRKSALAFGIFCISLVFLLETWVADRRMPNPASPFVWTVLGVAAAVSLAVAAWYRFKAHGKEDAS